MRVLHVLGELRPSGAEVMLRAAAGDWRAHGIEADVLAVGPHIGSFADELRASGYGVAHEPDARPARLPWRLWRRVRAGRYDVVHLHAERANFPFGAAARAAGAGVVRTVHAVFLLDGEPRWRRVLQRALLRAGGLAHVAVGPSVAANERARFRNPATVIPNWCDGSFLPPTAQERARARRDLGLPPHGPVVVSVGNCAPVKRHPAVLAALAHPACPPDLLYVHVGEEDPEQAERALAERLGVARRVRFVGRAAPLAALHAADAYVMPSAREGASVAALEALATGLPLVLADVPGLRDLAEHADTVTLTGVDPAALAAALAAAVSGPRARESRGRRMAQRYGAGRGTAAYAAAYRGVRKEVRGA
ncbi:glycosyltransferase [Streptomyces sp. NPDC050085]|uniref:glycosyltransferase n=1 Tax=Streptomyces sp. NPDC050085 TaxID=3365600 RepID=UPI0037A7B467